MTNASARQHEGEPQQERSPAEQAALKAAAGWMNLFSRTLKTCRLYDAHNPTVLRFRDELGTALGHVLKAHGPISYRFTSNDILVDEASVYPAKSRDDNLALAFFRDGVHALTFTPGCEPREVEAILNAVLTVTGSNEAADDLVTLLWEAHLPHVEMDVVPSEGDIGGAGGTPLDPDKPSPLPWPDPKAAAAGGPEAKDGKESDSAKTEEEAKGGSRSDDWATGDLTIEIEAAFGEIETILSQERHRFDEEFKSEHENSLIATAIALTRACLASNPTASDRSEVARFLPRALRQAIAQGLWRESGEVLALLQDCKSPEWSLETFAQELLQPISISAAIERLDQQDSHHVKQFITFAQGLGDPAVDLLNLVLGESKQRRTRRLLAEAVTEMCRGTPERLAPWLSDPRWYVVRNIIHILGWIGGPQIVNLLKTAARHPEAKVRHEVVSALGQIDVALARPLLIQMLEGADTRLFCLVLHQLSSARDTATAKLMLAYLQNERFEQRPIEEKRAIYSALSALGNDEILPDLEAELIKGGWFSRTQDSHKHAIARSIARLGTPASRELLERHSKSKRGAVRKACIDALAGIHS